LYADDFGPQYRVPPTVLQNWTVVVDWTVVVVRPVFSGSVDFVVVGADDDRTVVAEVTSVVVVLSGENRVGVVVEIPVASAEVVGVEELVVGKTNGLELVVMPEIVVLVLVVAPIAAEMEVVVDCELAAEGDVAVDPRPVVVVTLPATTEDVVVTTLDGQAS
jgi:hypothetical protein